MTTYILHLMIGRVVIRWKQEYRVLERISFYSSEELDSEWKKAKLTTPYYFNPRQQNKLDHVFCFVIKKQQITHFLHDSMAT